MVLGAQLRRLRERRGISREKAGWEIRSSESKISRMELGRVGFKERDVADLLTLYGVVDEHEREVLILLARQANQPNWWNRYGDVLPTWLQSYLGLEAAATLWMVIDEAALRRPMGGMAVMRGQIQALIAATERPNIKVQILPFHVGGHAAAGGAFTI